MSKLLIIAPFYPPHLGGLENYAEEFNKELSQRGHKIIIFTPHIPRHTPSYEENKNIQIIRFPALELITNYAIPKIWSPKFWTSLQKALNSKPNIIVSHTRIFFTSLMALIISKNKSLPWINIEHGSSFIQLSNPITSKFAKYYDLVFGRLVLKYSTINISISKAVQSFIKRFDQRPSPVIYRGINTADINNTPPANQPDNKIIIMSATRLSKWKGIEHNIEAVLSLPKKLQKKVIYYIVGSGEEQEYLKNKARSPIILLGQQSREQTIALMKSAHIYLHSSLPGGGLSSSLLEAMYCKCAIIATPNEGANEIIDDHKNGLSVPAANPTAIKDHLVTLITNQPLRENLANTAHQFINTNISWPRSITAFEKIISEL
jgi:glycosyltransferase involved in cell wall biosynthesis